MPDRRLYLLGIAVLGCFGDRVTQPSRVTQPASLTHGLPGDTVTLIGAGDIAGCRHPFFRDMLTAALITREPDALVFTAGDNAYPSGSTADYQCYDASWGAFKDRTYPVLGNHERMPDTSATGYYDYWNGVGVDSGRAGKRGRGYYAETHGMWRVLYLNSEQRINEQARWIRADLAEHPTLCQMMVLHKPLFTSGDERPNPKTRPLYRAFYDKRGDVAIAGHDHLYERTTFVRPKLATDAVDGVIDSARGMRQFIAGGGGHGLLNRFVDPPQPYSLKRSRTWGVLKLTLAPNGYTWEYRDIGEVVRDTGSTACR